MEEARGVPDVARAAARRRAPALNPSASAWVFASPAAHVPVERDVYRAPLRVLNSIRWVKEAGWHQKAEVEAQRRYLTAWEGVLFAERLTEGTRRGGPPCATVSRRIGRT